MSKTILIGILVVAVIIVGGILIVSMNNTNNTSPTATSPTSTSPNAPLTNPAPTVTTVTTVTTQQAGAPLVVTDVTAVPSNSTAVLTGKVTPNGAQASYWYEYGKTDTLGTQTAAQFIGSGFTAISAPAYITGLSASTTYFYRLAAQNNLGTTSGATYSFTTNKNQPPHGNTPTTRTRAATNISPISANLNGEASPNGSPTSYWFEYGDSAELGNVTTFQSAGDGTASVTTSVSLSNLKPLTKYYFRVNAQNQYGTANGAILNFMTQGPVNPVGPGAPAATTSDASNITKTAATLNGHVNPDGATTTYWFEYGLNALLGNILGNTSHTQAAGTGVASIAVSAQVSDLNASTTYYYRLVAKNSVGTTYSTAVMFQTKH